MICFSPDCHIFGKVKEKKFTFPALIWNKYIGYICRIIQNITAKHQNGLYKHKDLKTLVRFKKAVTKYLEKKRRKQAFLSYCPENYRALH